MKHYRRHSVIVGAGVMGCQLAYALCQQQEDVLLLEAHKLEANRLTVSSRASSLPLALINPLRGRSARLQAIDLAGLRALHQLEPRIRAKAFMPTGVLRIASNKKQAKTWQKRCKEYSTALELLWLEPRDVPSCYHAPFGALLIVEAGYVLPQQLLANVLNEAQHLGLEVWESARVQRLDSDTNTLYLKDSCIHAEHIFLCVGADKQGLQLVPDRELLSTLERIAGEVIGITMDTAGDISMPYALAGAIYGMQQGTHLYIGSNHRPADTVDLSAPQQLHKSASWFLPSLHDGRLGSSWTGVRCKAATPLPLVQSITPRLHFVGALAGRGFLCAAHIAQQVVRKIAS